MVGLIKDVGKWKNCIFLSKNLHFSFFLVLIAKDCLSNEAIFFNYTALLRERIA